MIAAYVAAILAAGAAPAAGQAPPTREQLANNPPLFLQLATTALKWNDPAEPVRIAGPIYFVGTQGLGVFLIKSSGGLILINTGMPPSGPLIAASIRKLGFDPADVKLLLVGHAHSDHAGGHAYIQQLSGAKVAAIAEERELLESGGKTDFMYSAYKEFWFDPVHVDQVFHDRDTLSLGDVKITALLTNGHTRGSTTFITQVVDNGISYTVVFPNGTSVNPGYRLVDKPSYPGIADDYQRTLQILAGLHPDIWLFAHTEDFGFAAKSARATSEGAKAWVDPAGYESWVAGQRAKFDAEVAAERGAGPAR